MSSPSRTIFTRRRHVPSATSPSTAIATATANNTHDEAGTSASHPHNNVHLQSLSDTTILPLNGKPSHHQHHHSPSSPSVFFGQKRRPSMSPRKRNHIHGRHHPLGHKNRFVYLLMLLIGLLLMYIYGVSYWVWTTSKENPRPAEWQLQVSTTRNVTGQEQKKSRVSSRRRQHHHHHHDNKPRPIPPRMVTVVNEENLLTMPRKAMTTSMTVSWPMEEIGKDDDNEEEEKLTIPGEQNVEETNPEKETLLVVTNQTRIANITAMPRTHGSNSTTSEDNAVSTEAKGDLMVVVAADNNDHNDTPPPCQPAEPWQTEMHPSCNSIHELDLVFPSHSSMEFLGQGWFRLAWRLDIKMNKEESMVLKMLRLEREYLEEYYELHRRDAVAMDHLTFSPYVMDIYGYCGQSALNELADFLPGVNALEQLDRRMRDKEGDTILLLKLRLALSISVGLYHVHYGRPGMPWDHAAEAKTNTTTMAWTNRASMVHYDMNPRNVAIVAGGNPKLNDFNIAEFLTYPSGEGGNETTCGFPSRLHEPWWRAPEEMQTTSSDPAQTNSVDEKVDVYSLGAILHHILTTHSPRGKMKKERMESVRAEVKQGIPPTLTEPWKSRKSLIVKAFRRAMDMCFEADPAKRATAGEVATVLYKALQKAPEMDLMAEYAEDAKEKKEKKEKTQDKHKHKPHHHGHHKVKP